MLSVNTWTGKTCCASILLATGGQSVNFNVRTAIGAAVVLILVQTYCSFMTPWILLMFAVWIIGGSKLV